VAGDMTHIYIIVTLCVVVRLCILLALSKFYTMLNNIGESEFHIPIYVYYITRHYIRYMHYRFCFICSNTILIDMLNQRFKYTLLFSYALNSVIL
jgi:hypothetical protein